VSKSGETPCPLPIQAVTPLAGLQYSAIGDRFTPGCKFPHPADIEADSAVVTLKDV